jgi:hypothetical protein
MSEDRFTVIKNAVYARNLFLEAHPEMQSYQNEIDEQLKKAGSQHNRNAMLAQMMRQKLYELELKLKELAAVVL